MQLYHTSNHNSTEDSAAPVPTALTAWLSSLTAESDCKAGPTETAFGRWFHSAFGRLRLSLNRSALVKSVSTVRDVTVDDSRRAGAESAVT